jgi:RNA-binding protein 39
VEEVTTTELPKDAAQRVQNANLALIHLQGSGLLAMPSVVPGMNMNMGMGMGMAPPAPMTGGIPYAVGALPPAVAAQQTAIADAAEAAINAALGLPAGASPVPMATIYPIPSAMSPAVTTPAVVVTSPDAKKVGGSESPTTVILVHNMFDKDEETEEGWEEDIRLDFEEESAKYGAMKKVVVVFNEPGGKLYASFETVDGAKACAENLAGRWFDKRQLRVEFVSNLPSNELKLV